LLKKNLKKEKQQRKYRRR